VTEFGYETVAPLLAQFIAKGATRRLVQEVLVYAPAAHISPERTSDAMGAAIILIKADCLRHHEQCRRLVATVLIGQHEAPGVSEAGGRRSAAAAFHGKAIWAFLPESFETARRELRRESNLLVDVHRRTFGVDVDEVEGVKACWWARWQLVVVQGSVAVVQCPRAAHE
jgi:hypothetical protein